MPPRHVDRRRGPAACRPCQLWNTRPVSGWTIRRATSDDAYAVVELRALMFASMGVAGVDDTRWRQAAHEWLARELGGRHTCVALAVGDDGRVAAGAMAALRFETPSPVN